MAKQRSNEAADETRNADLTPIDGGLSEGAADDIQWTSDDVPRISIGEGMTKGENPQPRVSEVQGKYLYSVRQKIKRRMTTMHRMYGKAPGMPTKGEFLIYGSGAINQKIALLPQGTQIRLTYLGAKDVGQDSLMKVIKLEWPRGTKLLGTPNLPTQINDTDEGEPDYDA